MLIHSIQVILFLCCSTQYIQNKLYCSYVDVLNTFKTSYIVPMLYVDTFNTSYIVPMLMYSIHSKQAILFLHCMLIHSIQVILFLCCSTQYIQNKLYCSYVDTFNTSYIVPMLLYSIHSKQAILFLC